MYDHSARSSVIDALKHGFFCLRCEGRASAGQIRSAYHSRVPATALTHPCQCIRSIDGPASALQSEPSNSLPVTAPDALRMFKPALSPFVGPDAREELVAELGYSVPLSSALTVELTPEIRYNHTAYIASWISVPNDKRTIFSAAAHEQKASGYLHRLQAQPTKPPEGGLYRPRRSPRNGFG